MKPSILTLTGPSCAGKSTLEKLLRDKHGFMNAISTTTRPMRAGEVDGESYYFVSREEFERTARAGGFVESVEFNGNYYGVSAQEIDRLASIGKPIVVVVEPEGLLQIREYGFNHDWDVYSVFVDSPTDLIASRFMERYTSDFARALGKDGGEASRKVLQTYSKRLAVMLEDEVQWASECELDVELFITRFDADTQDAAIDEILLEFQRWVDADAADDS